MRLEEDTCRILVLKYDFLPKTFDSDLSCFCFQVIPQDGAGGADRLRAIELSVPNVVATFRVVHRDRHLNVIDTRTYNIDLNSGENRVLKTKIYSGTGVDVMVTTFCNFCQFSSKKVFFPKINVLITLLQKLAVF
jgi:hypothetical protein